MMLRCSTIHHLIVVSAVLVAFSYFFFFFNDTATTEIYTLSLHDALPISGPVPNGEGTPHRARLHALHRGAAVGHRVDDAEVVEVAYLVVVLGVGDRRAEDLLDDPGRGPRRVLERRECLADRLSADLVQHEPRLPGGHADETGTRECPHGATPSPWARSQPSQPSRAP